MIKIDLFFNWMNGLESQKVIKSESLAIQMCERC